MIHIGDIVRPIESCIGHQFEFVVRYDSPSPKFKLKATNNIIDPMYGPYEKQMEEMKRAEESEWCANELELVKNGPTLSQALEANHIIFEEFLQNEKYRHNALNILTENLCECNINNNEEDNKNMKILELYKERKEEAILEDYNNQRDKILAEDEIQKIIKEMVHQVNSIFENEEREDRLYIDSKDFYQEITMDKLDELDELKENEVAELDKTIEEIEALFDLTEDYEERMKILKKYGIINKDGKLSI